MALTLTTFASGATIDATVLRSKLAQIEAYVNEGIIATDRDDAWMSANHLYRPDFFGGANPHTTLVSGESYFRERPLAEERRAFFSYFLGAGPYPVPGLNATIQIPEALNPASTRYRLLVAVSFYLYEYGGADAYLDEDTSRAASVDLLINGVAARSNTMVRYIYKGSITSAGQAVAFFPRKQISMVWGDTSAPVAAVGVNHIGVAISPINPGAPEYWKHLIFVQGNIVCRYFIR